MIYTMREVAKRAGVSAATVSRVLNKRRDISAETSRRVLDVVSELQYRKNVHARRLATGQSNILGLVISEITNPYFPGTDQRISGGRLGRRLRRLALQYRVQRGAGRAGYQKAH